jgi:formamidopyrimidine-DNA glycosylase
MQAVLDEAIQTLSARLGDQIDVEVRDFLSMHDQGGLPCPRCGSAISEVKRQGPATHFCRTCQPGVVVAR